MAFRLTSCGTALWCVLFSFWVSPARATPDFAAVLQAIERVESGGFALAIRDNTDNRSLFPHSLDDAVATGNELLNYNHDIDVGAMQINRMHFGTTLRDMGLRWQQLFDPVIARQVAQVILMDIYHRVSVRLGNDGDLAFWRAVGCYNGGESTYTYVDNAPYEAKVMAAMGLPPAVQPGAHAWAAVAVAGQRFASGFPGTAKRIDEGLQLALNGRPLRSHAGGRLAEALLIGGIAGLIGFTVCASGLWFLFRVLVLRTIVEICRGSARI